MAVAAAMTAMPACAQWLEPDTTDTAASGGQSSESQEYAALLLLGAGLIPLFESHGHGQNFTSDSTEGVLTGSPQAGGATGGNLPLSGYRNPPAPTDTGITGFTPGSNTGGSPGATGNPPVPGDGPPGGGGAPDPLVPEPGPLVLALAAAVVGTAVLRPIRRWRRGG